MKREKKMKTGTKVCWLIVLGIFVTAIYITIFNPSRGSYALWSLICLLLLYLLIYFIIRVVGKSVNRKIRSRLKKNKTQK